jgi:NAD(P)H dehydrogenase (quinone)
MVKALVLFHSQQFGNTELMARAIGEGLKESGAEVMLHNANGMRFNIENFRQYDCVAFGTPDYFSYIAGTMKTFMDDWYLKRNESGYTEKPYAVFYSHGGGGRVREHLDLFSRVGEQIGQVVESRGKPTKNILEECWELGNKLSKAAK